MVCKIENDSKLIPMHALKDGQIAVIVDTTRSYAGQLVTPYYDSGRNLCGFMVLGGKCGGRFSSTNTLLVRVLEEGEKIEVGYSK